MSDTQTILKLIEDVDPADDRTMDNINFEVGLFLERPKNERHIRDKIVYWHPGKDYVRSRDALKDIRPKGWRWEVGDIINHDKFYSHFSNHNLGHGETAARFHCIAKTEELAELMGIIKALEWGGS